MVWLLPLLISCATPPPASDGSDGDEGAGSTDDTAALEGCPPPEPELATCELSLRSETPRTRDTPDLERTWFDAEGRAVATWSRSGEELDEEARSCANTWGTGLELLEERCWGGATYTYTWIWEDGLPVGRTYDKDSDGSIERSWSYRHEEGLMVEESWDSDGDGEADGRTVYTWSQGLLVLEEWDYQGDGELDLSVAYAHDQGGFVVLEERDEDGDGLVDESTSTTRDPAGSPLEEELDKDADGAWDQRRTWTWEDCTNTRIDTALSTGASHHTLRRWEGERLVLEADHLDNYEGWDERRAWTWTCPAEEAAPTPPD